MHKKGKRWTKEDVVNQYQTIRREYGNKAKSSQWIQEHGYRGLYQYVGKSFKNWIDFKKQAGFNEDPLHKSLDLIQLIQAYSRIRRQYGHRAKSCRWIINNGFSNIYQQSKKSFNSWNDFKKQAGFDESPLWTKWTKEKAIEEYRKIRKEHGDKAKSSFWMLRNGYSGLCQYALNQVGNWKNFKEQAGFNV